MTKTISSSEMRGRMFRRLEQSRVEASDWRKVIGVEGNRDLLAIIASNQPESIAELAREVGRAQPNVSRSLAALVRAGFVELQAEGRVTRPKLTPFGAEKVEALELSPPAFAGSLPDVLEEQTEEGFFTADINSSEEPVDITMGDLRVILRCSDSVERHGRASDKDLYEMSVRLLNDWWRVFHRRDAPYKVAELTLQVKNSQCPAALYFTSWGRNIDVRMRERVPGPEASAPAVRTHIKSVEIAILDGLCRPVARSLRQRQRNDRPIHSLLARLESIFDQPSEATFCRTAGALGLSPYLLDESAASQVAGLIERLPQEEARLDFASAVLDRLSESEEWMDQEERLRGDSNQLSGLLDLAKACETSTNEAGLRPHKRGLKCAKRMRKALGLDPETSVGGVTGLIKLLGGGHNFTASPKAPGALRGIQTRGHASPSIMVAGEGEESTTFLIARAVGDFTSFGDQRSCVADLYTDRQAVGRAFAAELLAPAEAVVHMIENRDRSYHEIAEHFGAPVRVVELQYQNNAGRYA